MRRTEAREAVRMAMFLSILNRWELAALNQEEAAELLGVSERDVSALDAPLRGGRRGRPRRPPAARQGVGRASPERSGGGGGATLVRERYPGFTVKHLYEHLVKDHGFGWGYTWLKLHLQWAGLAPKAPRKGAHRRKRERRPLPDMMLHQKKKKNKIDGSRHEWLEGQAPLDLIVTLDDATGAIYSAFLSRRKARPRPSGR